LPAAIICLANGQLETKEFLFAIYSPTNNDSQAFRSASLTCEYGALADRQVSSRQLKKVCTRRAKPIEQYQNPGDTLLRPAGDEDQAFERKTLTRSKLPSRPTIPATFQCQSAHKTRESSGSGVLLQL